MQIRRRRRLKFENIESRYLLTAATTVYGQVHVEVNWDAKLTRDFVDTSIVDVVSNTDGAFLNGVVAKQSNFKIIELPMNDVAEIRETWTNQWDANRDLLFLGSNALQPFVDIRSQLGNQRLFDTPAFDFDLDIAEEVTTNGEFHVTTPSPPLTNQETTTLDSAGAGNIVNADPPRVEITTPPNDVESIVTHSPPVTSPPIVSPPSVEIPATGLPLVHDANPPTLEPSHQIDLDFVSKFQSESTTLEPLQGHTSNYDLESSFEVTTPQIPSTPNDTSWFEPTSVSLSPTEPTHVTTTSVAENSELTPVFELSESILNEAISTSTTIDIEPPSLNIADSSPSRVATQSPLNQQSSEDPALTTKSDTTSSDPAISSEIPQQSLMNVADYMDVAHDMTNKVMGVSDESIEMPRDTDDLIDAEFADRESSEVLRIPAGTDEEFIDVGEISAATDQAMYIPTWFDVAEFGETSSGQQVVPAYEVGAYSVSRPIEFDQTTSTEEPAENAAVQALPASDTKSASTGRITTQYVAATTGSEHLVMPAVAEGSSMELIATSIVTLASSSIKNASVDGDRLTEEMESENDGTRYGTMAQATLIAICGATLFYTRETDRRSKRAEFDRDVDREITQIA